MSDLIERTELESALLQRIEVAEGALGLERRPGDDVASRLEPMLRRAKADRLGPEAWLVFAVISGVMADRLDLAAFGRELALAEDGRLLAAALRAATPAIERTTPPSGRVTPATRHLELVSDETVVDVTFCAQHDHNTGIQRVVRAAMPRWKRDGRPFVLVRWSPIGGGYRRLTTVETSRVLEWTGSRGARTIEPEDQATETLVLPWRTTVFLPEVPAFEQCSPSACLAQSSGNRLTLIGYDAIPLVSAADVNAAESGRFAHYLSIVKHAHRVAAISESAADEFRGFTAMLPLQNLDGPEVRSVPLAVDVPAEARAVAGNPDSDLPVVICLGSHEPRKNQEAVLAAAEALQREGLRFRMVFVGGGSREATHAFDRQISRMQRDGLTVESHRRLADTDLWTLFADARFSVFVSTHEGFGLPVAESLALGTPVLTSDYGSLAEIAAHGGCVMVDPRDDDQIEHGMRRMLTDDDLIAGLRESARSIQARSWDEYADELWTQAGEGAVAR